MVVPFHSVLLIRILFTPYFDRFVQLFLEHPEVLFRRIQFMFFRYPATFAIGYGKCSFRAYRSAQILLSASLSTCPMRCSLFKRSKPFNVFIMPSLGVNAPSAVSPQSGSVSMPHLPFQRKCITYFWH